MPIHKKTNALWLCLTFFYFNNPLQTEIQWKDKARQTREHWVLDYRFGGEVGTLKCVFNKPATVLFPGLNSKSSLFSPESRL